MQQMQPFATFSLTHLLSQIHRCTPRTSPPRTCAQSQKSQLQLHPQFKQFRCANGATNASIARVPLRGSLPRCLRACLKTQFSPPLRKRIFDETKPTPPPNPVNALLSGPPSPAHSAVSLAFPISRPSWPDPKANPSPAGSSPEPVSPPPIR